MSRGNVETFRLDVLYGTGRIPCEVRLSPSRLRSSVAIHVEPDGRVLIDAPCRASRCDIRRAISKRAAWIDRQRCAAETRQRQVLYREYVSGEALHYLGRRYCLKVLVEPESEGVKLRGAHLEVRCPERDAARVRLQLEAWYRERAEAVLRARVEAVAADLSWLKHEPEVRIRRMWRQWGSCSPRGTITLNMALVRAPRECIDYVVLHELCHLRSHNHGPNFYRLLSRHMPDWRATKQGLDSMAESFLMSASANRG